LASSEGDDGIWEGSTDTFSLKLDQERRFVSIGDVVERDIPETETDGVDDAAVSDTLRTFLVGLGAREAELGQPEVRALLSQVQDETDGTEGPITMVGKAAFFTRQLGGIMVLGDRFQLTVTPQGELFTISGRWTPIDYAHSVLTAAITGEEVVDRAVSVLIEEGVAVEHSPHIAIYTAYRIVDDATYGEIAVLKGFVAERYHQEPDIGDDNGWPASVNTYEFDL
jgi:hypothetical protein